LALTLRNDRAGLVMWDNVRALAPWGVGGVFIGYFVGNAIDDKVVALVLGAFAAWFGGRMGTVDPTITPAQHPLR
jgi:uncharacterized membrane protein YfcA